MPEETISLALAAERLAEYFWDEELNVTRTRSKETKALVWDGLVVLARKILTGDPDART